VYLQNNQSCREELTQRPSRRRKPQQASRIPICFLPEPVFVVPLKEEEKPPDLIDLANELRNTLARQHVFDGYRKQRGQVIPKVVNKDRVHMENAGAIVDNVFSRL